jgi:hypothetical protein
LRVTESAIELLQNSLLTDLSANYFDVNVKESQESTRPTNKTREVILVDTSVSSVIKSIDCVSYLYTRRCELITNLERKCSVEEAELSAFSSSAFGLLTLVCHSKASPTHLHFISSVKLTDVDSIDKISFYHEQKSDSIHIVGTSIGCDIVLFKVPLNSMRFFEVMPEESTSTITYVLPKEVVLARSSFEMRDLKLSTSLKYIDCCPSRGMVFLLENNGRLVVLDVEDNEEDESDEEEADQ